MKKPLILLIRDGWGIGEDYEGNAVRVAETPVMNSLLSNYPNCVLSTAGEAVGLRPGVMGSSEVGHLNIGAGRIVEQELVRVDKLIENRKLFTQPALVRIVKNCKAHNSKMHLMGLVQDQGVHADEAHLYAILAFLKKVSIERVFVHFFADGRDTPPRSALTYLARLEEKLNQYRLGQLASVMGRYYAMDRVKNWHRTERAYKALVFGEGLKAPSGREAIESAYRRADKHLAMRKHNNCSNSVLPADEAVPVETDEFIQPTLISNSNGDCLGLIEDDDSVLHFNYRQDRAIQLTKAFVEQDPFPFDRKRIPKVSYAGLTRYYDEFQYAIIPPLELKNILGEILSTNGLWQLRISEYQKYRHVTSFFNGKRIQPFPREDRVQVPSISIPENLKPEMSAYETAELAIFAIRHGIFDLRKRVQTMRDMSCHFDESQWKGSIDPKATYDVIVLNFANCDMVGHTGDFQAAVKAVEVVDECVGRVVDAVLARDGQVLVTSDHGNVDEMTNPIDGSPKTAHSKNDVEFVLVGNDVSELHLRPHGILSDIAPTMLELLGIPVPVEMTATSLIKKGQKG